MKKNVGYVLVDAETGYSTSVHSVPVKRFTANVPEGQRMVVPADGVLPRNQMRVDLSQVDRELVAVHSMSDVHVGSRAELPFEIVVAKAIGEIDRLFASRLAGLCGPLAAIHAEKRRQAEAGGGPLIKDEADRQAIIANAAAQDEQIAKIERERRAIKAALRAATSEDEVQAIVSAGIRRP